MLLIITSTGDRLFKFINIYDLKYMDAAHISILKCNEMAGVRQRQPAYEIFSTKRRFQQSKSRSDPLGSWSPAQAGVKDGYPF